jgi:hypothetical protein
MHSPSGLPRRPPSGCDSASQTQGRATGSIAYVVLASLQYVVRIWAITCCLQLGHTSTSFCGTRFSRAAHPPCGLLQKRYVMTYAVCAAWDQHLTWVAAPAGNQNGL